MRTGPFTDQTASDLQLHQVRRFVEKSSGDHGYVIVLKPPDCGNKRIQMASMPEKPGREDVERRENCRITWGCPVCPTLKIIANTRTNDVFVIQTARVANQQTQWRV